MNKKISLGAALALMLVITAVTFSVTMLFSEQMFNRTVSNISQREAQYEKLSEIDKYVRANFDGTIDDNRLNDHIAAGYIAGLNDPYCTYITAEQYATIKQESEGKIVGIGITVSKNESGYIHVDEVYPDSPAEQANLKAGDLIIKVNDIDVTSDSYEQARNSITGKAGTKLSLVVRRDMEDHTIQEITRRSVQKPTVYSGMYGEAGYIRITDFNTNTYDQFRKAVDDLRNNRSAKALIFDVRNNEGGSLESVLKILDMLLPEGDIATATYKGGETKVLGTSDASCIKLPMVVLTNNKTASAAELFTQALRDYGVAKSVGETTMGKGVMQNTQPLKDGSAIRLTIAKYNPPKSANFNGIGIKPDYEVTLNEAQKQMSALLDETTDPQLKKAIELTKVDPNAEIEPTEITAAGSLPTSNAIVDDNSLKESTEDSTSDDSTGETADGKDDSSEDSTSDEDSTDDESSNTEDTEDTETTDDNTTTE